MQIILAQRPNEFAGCRYTLDQSYSHSRSHRIMYASVYISSRGHCQWYTELVQPQESRPATLETDRAASTIAQGDRRSQMNVSDFINRNFGRV